MVCVTTPTTLTDRQLGARAAAQADRRRADRAEARGWHTTAAAYRALADALDAL